MIFKRAFVPMLVLGILFTMGSMAYAQSTVTCSMFNSTSAAVPGTPPFPVSNINGVGLVGPSAHASNTGLTEVPSAGPADVPLTTGFAGNPAVASGGTVIPGGGTIRVACFNTGAAATPGVEVLTVGFGTTITNTTAHPNGTGTAIRITNCTGAFSLAAPGCAPGTGLVGISTVGNSGGTIVIGLGSPTTTTTTNPNTSITFPAG